MPVCHKNNTPKKWNFFSNAPSNKLIDDEIWIIDTVLAAVLLSWILISVHLSSSPLKASSFLCFPVFWVRRKQGPNPYLYLLTQNRPFITNEIEMGYSLIHCLFNKICLIYTMNNY